MIDIAGVRREVDRQAGIEVICDREARRTVGGVSGIWSINLIPKDGEHRGLSIPVYRKTTFQPLKFTTAHGVTSFAVRLGFFTCTIPLEKGTSAVWVKKNDANG